MTELEVQLQTQKPQRWLDYTLALAVSGGADSMALLRFFVQLRNVHKPTGRIVVLHANHQLRGEESDGDEAFVREQCVLLGVPCVARRLVIARTSEGLEQDARAARYAFLEKAAFDVGARYLLTAHNQNDQVETILHRIVRGTGMAGLSGMAPVRQLSSGLILLRPLLGVTREEILRYLASLGQSYRTDSTNADTHLTRNRIRQTLVPFLKEHFNAQLDSALLRLGEIASETRDFLDLQTEPLFQKALTRDSQTISISLDVLQKEPLFLQKEFLRRVWQGEAFPERDMGKEQWTEFFTLLNTDGVRLFPGNIRVCRKGNVLEIQKRS